MSTEQQLAEKGLEAAKKELGLRASMRAEEGEKLQVSDIRAARHAALVATSPRVSSSFKIAVRGLQEYIDSQHLADHFRDEDLLEVDVLLNRPRGQSVL